MRSPRLLTVIPALLLAAVPALASADEPPTWVFFGDRGRPDAALAAAVDERTSELTPRALERRRRVRGDHGVDVRDLAPDHAQVAAVLATGARLRSTSRWLNAISVDAEPAQRTAIAALSVVARVQPVARRHAAAPPSLRRDEAPAPRDADDHGVAREQLDRLGIPALHACGFTGAGVLVGVQDSGFSLEHAALAGIHVVAARDFLDNDDVVADQPGDPDGQDDHGTMILSLLAGADPGNYMGAAPGVAVILAKTEDSSVEEPFEEDRFVAGLEWIESMGADVFTSSLGYSDWYTPQDFDGETAVTTRAATVAAAQGLIMIGSIGNSGPGPTTLIAPSDADLLIAVGAVGPDDVVAEFSSRGPTADGRIKPDLVAPGQGVWVVDPGSQDEYGRGNGTSLAAPLVAGAAALLLEAFPELDPEAMRSLLRQSASRADAPDNDVGWGVPDVTRPLAQQCADTGQDPGADAETSTGDAPGDPEPADPTTTSADAEPASSASSEDPGDDDARAGEGCACTSAPTTWPTMLALPWLLFFLRLRITQDPRRTGNRGPNHVPPGNTHVDAAGGNTLTCDPSLSEPAQCSMLRTLRP